jgi:class 3 adenylate cyclase
VDVTSTYKSSLSGGLSRRSAQTGAKHKTPWKAALALAIVLIVAVAILATLAGVVGNRVSQIATTLESETNARVEAMVQSIRCLSYVDEELWCATAYIMARDPPNRYALTYAATRTTENCGLAMLHANPAAFRALMRNLGASRQAVLSGTEPRLVPSNFSEIAISLVGTIEALGLAMSPQALPSGWHGPAVAQVVSVASATARIAALELLGTATGDASAVYKARRALESEFEAAVTVGGVASQVLQDARMNDCVNAILGTSFTNEGSSTTRVCYDLLVLMLEAGQSSALESQVEGKGYSDTTSRTVPSLYAVVGTACAVGFLAIGGLVHAQRRSTKDLEAEIEKRKEVTDSVQAFVPAQFLVILGLRVITEITVDEPIELDATILASDIRQFTSISEQMSDLELFAWLQEHLSSVTSATRRAGGFVEKYIGDAVLCIFEVPGDAIRCALEMQYVVAETNVTRVTRGEEYMVRVGVGVHSGPALIGILGDALTQNTAVVGRGVDIATKLEELTKVYGAKIIVSEAAFDAANIELPDFRRLGEAKIDGEIIRLVEIFSTEPAPIRKYKQATRADFEAAVAARDRGNIREANARFDAVIRASKPSGYDDLAAVKVIEL